MNKCKSEGMLHKNQRSPLLCMCMHVRALALNPLTGLQGVLSFVRSFLSTHICGLQRCQGPCLGLQRNGFSMGRVSAEPKVTLSFYHLRTWEHVFAEFVVWPVTHTMPGLQTDVCCRNGVKYWLRCLLRKNAAGHFSASTDAWGPKCWNGLHFACPRCYLEASAKWVVL